jgi:hypothetical protein
MLYDLRPPPLLAGVDDDGHENGRRPRAEEVILAELLVHASRAAEVEVLVAHPDQPEPQPAILQLGCKFEKNVSGNLVQGREQSVVRGTWSMVVNFDGAVL